MDGGIELVQTGERHPLYVKVNGTVEKLHGIFNQGLVLGMAYTGRIDRAAVMFGKSGEIIIDDRLIAVTSSNSRLQIVGNYGCRNAFKIVHGIFTALYQVFLALGPYRLAVGIMTKRQDGDKHLGFLRLACHLINDFKPVTGKINIHLVCGIVFDMADNLDVKLILADCPFERRQLITVRIFSMVLLKQFSDTRLFSFRRDTYPGSKTSSSICLEEGPRCRDSVQPNISCNCSLERERSCSILFPLERNRRTYLRTVLREV